MKLVKSKLALIGLMLCLPILSLASCLVPPFHAQYSYYKNGSNVGVTRLSYIKLNDDHYRLVADSDFHWAFIHRHILETSIGKLTTQGIQPLQHMTYQGHKRIAFNSPVAGQVQDTLSKDIALRLHFARSLKPITLKRLNDKGQFEITASMVKNNQIINTSIGKVKALQIRYHDNLGNTVYQWLAKDKDYIPVVTKIIKEGQLQAAIYLTNYQPTGC